MYMSDTEVQNLFTKALSWLRPGGFMFFNETCFKIGGVYFAFLHGLILSSLFNLLHSVVGPYVTA